MEERNVVISGNSCRLLISLAEKEKWQKKTEASFRIHNDRAVVSLRAYLEDFSEALQKQDTSAFRAFRGILSEDYVIIDVSKAAEDRVSLTLIQGGVRCLASAFQMVTLQDTISGLLGKSK